MRFYDLSVHALFKGPQMLAASSRLLFHRVSISNLVIDHLRYIRRLQSTESAETGN